MQLPKVIVLELALIDEAIRWNNSKSGDNRAALLMAAKAFGIEAERVLHLEPKGDKKP